MTALGGGPRMDGSFPPAPLRVPAGKPGTYTFRCTIHPQMHGSLTMSL